MSHRRRGQDFSHLLDSAWDTSDCGPDLNKSLSEGLSAQSDDRSESSKNMHSKEESGASSHVQSTILAGQAAESESQGSTENSYLTANTGSIEEEATKSDSLQSCRSEFPSMMNRAIEQKFRPQSELDLSQSSVESRHESSSDLEDNAQNTIKDSLISGFATMKIDSPMIKAACSKNDSQKFIKDSPRNNHFRSNMFKRWSQEFISSPQKFTEKLVTIIDESETGFAGNDSGVNLSRMANEFKKMCKYIQDESMPEHLNSTFGIANHLEENREEKRKRNIPQTIDESPVEFSENLDSPVTNAWRKGSSQKTPVNRFKKMVKESHEADSPGSPNSTKNFVFLEKLLSDQSSPRTDSRQTVRTTSSSDISEHIRDKVTIINRAREQWASLDDANGRSFETFNSHPHQEVQKSENSRDGDFEDSIEENQALDEDELSRSLKIELEKQRQRCFETARQIQQIEEEAKTSNEDYPKVLERHGIDPETECRKTMNSLLAYQNCWAKIRQSQQNVKKNELSSLDSGIDIRSNSKTLLASKNSEALAQSGKKRREPTPSRLAATPGRQSPRRRFFLTPGKTPPISNTKKRTKPFFSNVETDVPQQGTEMIFRSPHAPGIYRKGFNSSVISPVSMYIRGTDFNLIQNVQEKKNERFLTPTKGKENSAEKLKFNLAPKTSTPQSSPFQHASSEKDCGVLPASNDENRNVAFTLPKVNYELSSRVRTVDGSLKNIGGTRTRGLLQSMQNRVVIRHKGRLFEDRDDDNVPESCTESHDVSVHVKTPAKKTNYVNHWRK